MTQMLPPATTAVTDAVTIRARVDEALAVHPLPQPHRIKTCINRAAGLDGMSPELQALARQLPPALTIWCHTTLDLQVWAAYFGAVTEVRVRTYEDDGRTCRTVDARGSWLGWRVNLHSREDSYRDVTPPAPLAMVRKAALGALL